MSRSMSSSQLRSYLDKMRSPDADFRCMALIDLVKEIRSVPPPPSTSAPKKTSLPPVAPYTLDEASEKQLFDIVLEMIDDSNSEVKNKAVEALAALTSICQKQNLITLAMTKLIQQLESEEEEKRDISTLAIRALLTEISVSGAVAADVVEKVVTNLVKQLASPDIPTQHTVELIDILTLIYQRFSTRISSRPNLQTASLATLLSLLSSSRTHIRKRAIISLGHLVPASDPTLFDSLSKSLIEVLTEEAQNNGTKIAYAQLVGGLAKVIPQRIGGLLPAVMPGILSLTMVTGDEEALESGLTTLETLTLRCPTEITPFLSQIVDRATTLLKYDPNYAGGDDDEDEEMADGDDDMMDDDEFEDEYTDDEDASWKARRSSARLLQALMGTRPEMLNEWYSSVSPLLTSRLSEREESVRLEIFAAWEVLLRQTAVYGGSSIVSAGEAPQRLKRKRLDSESHSGVVDMSNPLAAQVPALSKAIIKQSMTKSLATKEKSFVVLKALTEAVGGGLENQASAVANSAKSALVAAESASLGGATSAGLAATVLSFLGVFFRTHPPKVYSESLSQLVPIVVQSMSNRYHRISLEAFAAASSLAKGLRPQALAGNASPLPNLYGSSIQQIYSGTYAILSDTSADADVKERALVTLGDLLAYEGDSLSGQFEECLPTITARLGNDATQLTALKVIAAISESSNCQGQIFESWLNSVLEQFPMIFRRGQKATKSTALHSLPSLMTRVGSKIPAATAEAITVELRTFIVDSDLVNLPLALNASVILLKAQPKLRSTVDTQLMPQVMTLMQSSLVNGVALDSLLAFISAYVSADPQCAPKMVAEMRETLGRGSDIPTAAKGGAHGYATVAKCSGVAILCSGGQAQSLVLEYGNLLKTPKTPDTAKYLSLLTLGEVGRSVDMTFAPDIFDCVLKCFDSNIEELKSAAAFAAGNVAVGNVATYLPRIVQQVSAASSPATRLLYLHSLKEAILHCSTAQLEGVADTLWQPLLSDNAVGQDDGARNVRAAILGKLTTTRPSRYLPELQSRITSDQTSTRATVASAIRYAFIDTSDSFDEILSPMILNFLSLMGDPDHVVRRLAVASFSAAAQHKPDLLQDHLPTLLPMLLKETERRPELVRKIPMGPFTIEIDDGLENRKAAFEAMLILLTACVAYIDITAFLDRVINGLKDLDDVKVLCYMALHRLGQVAPTAVLSRLDDCAEGIAETMKGIAVVKKDAMGQDIQRNEEMQRSAIRTIVPLYRLTSEAQNPKFYRVVRPLEVSEKWRDEFKVSPY